MGESGTQFFCGQSTRKLDEKNRLTIPSDWRFKAEGNAVFLAIPNPVGCISVYPPDMVMQLVEAARQPTLSSPAKQRALSSLARLACKVSCDKAGRITLEDRLLKHAGISSDVVLVGEFTKFHVWSPSRLKAEDKKSQELGEIFDTLRELGL